MSTKTNQDRLPPHSMEADNLFPIESTPKPALQQARERLDALELAYDKAWTAMEDYGDPPPPMILSENIKAAQAEVKRLELEELNKRKL